MAIDKAELATELEKNPEIEKVATDALVKKGFVIRDKATDTTFMENYKKDVIEKEIPGKIAEVHGQYDKDIETALGVKKDANEKSYEYLKRASKVKLEELNGKITEYEKTIREKGDPSGILQKKIEAAEEKARVAIADRDKQISDLSAKTELTTRQMMLNTQYAELSKTFKKELPPLWDRTARIVLEDILKTTVMKEGVLYVGDGQGGVKKDASFNPIKVEDHLKAEFKDVIDVKREQNGAGSKGGGTGDSTLDPETITKDNFIMPPTVKNQSDLIDAIVAAGIAKGTAKFNDIYNKFGLGKDYEIVSGKKVEKKVGPGLPSAFK